MTKEALKLALEALESSDKLINGSGNHFGLEGAMDGYYSGCFDVGGNNKLLNKAIAAIKEALAQPEQEPDLEGELQTMSDLIVLITRQRDGFAHELTEHSKLIAVQTARIVDLQTHIENLEGEE